MKVLFALALISTNASAAVLSNKAYLAIDQESGNYYGTDLAEIHYCAGQATPLDFMSFEAAKAVMAMPSGHYECEGDFLNNRATKSFQIVDGGFEIFRLGKCKELTREDIVNFCK